MFLKLNLKTIFIDNYNNYYFQINQYLSLYTFDLKFKSSYLVGTFDVHIGICP